MTAGKKRPLPTSVFKAKVGLETLKGEKRPIAIAQKYQVHPETVRQCKKEILERASSLFDSKRGCEEGRKRGRSRTPV